MNIAELFLNLGVKGSEKTVGALTGMQKGLKDTSSMALETKVALVGAVYAMERLFAASGQRGTDLTNLNSVLGVSTKTLQQYEYAARQVGVSNETVDNTFKSLQTSMTNVLLGKGAPEGMAMIAKVTGIQDKDIKDFAEHPEKLLQKLQEYAQKETNIPLKNANLKSFGLGDDMIASLNRNAYRPEVLKAAPTYGKGEVNQLDKANVAWSNLKNKIEMSVGHFNAEHGVQLVQGISKITDQVLQLAEAFEKFATKLKLFEWFGKMLSGWTTILGGLTGAVDTISGAVSDPKKAEALKKNATSFIANDLPNLFGELKNEIFGEDKTKQVIPPNKVSSDHRLVVPTSPVMPKTANAISPPVSPIATKRTSQTINVNQNLNFQHDGKDAGQTADSTKKAIKDAFRQIPQAQGN